MLPKPIIDELFNLACRVGDAVIDHICDELQRHSLNIDHYDNYDTAIIIYFNRDDQKMDGELRVDRIARQFDIAIRCGDETILPMSGDWGLVEAYLEACDKRRHI